MSTSRGRWRKLTSRRGSFSPFGTVLVVAALGAVIPLGTANKAYATTVGPLIVGNNAAFGGGSIQTYDFSTGALANSFVPTAASSGTRNNGRAVVVVGNQVFYSELNNGFGPSDAIHIAPFNGGAGGADVGTLPNPAPSVGVQDLKFANGVLYALTGYTPGPLQVWKLNPTNGAVLAGPISINSNPTADGFAVLPNGDFLINSGDESCTYSHYNATTGAPTGSSITVPGASSCTGADTDGTTLFFETDFSAFTETSLTGNLISRTTVASNVIEDISLVHAAGQPPSPPRQVSVTPGDGTATISWTPPGSAGSSPISGYQVYLVRSTTSGSPIGSPEFVTSVPASRTSVTIPGLLQDCYTTFAFFVEAVTSVGSTASSQSHFYLTSGYPPTTAPAITVVLLDGAPSSEAGGTFYPLTVPSPAKGIGTVSNYCPTTVNNSMNQYARGLKDSMWRWSEFPVPGSSSSGGSAPTSGTACLNSNVPTNCLTARLAGKGAVLLPFSYTGATLTASANATEFNMPSYKSDDSAQGDPATQRARLDAEISSIHGLWPHTSVVLIGHSFGGMLAEQWWRLYRPNYSDHDGVSWVFSLDSPINGIRNSDVAPYSSSIKDLWAKLWDNLFTNGSEDQQILNQDSDGSYTAIGTPDDATFGFFADGNNPGITSQLDFTVSGGNLYETSVDFQSPCSAQAQIAGTTYGHDTPKVCSQVLDLISGKVGS